MKAVTFWGKVKKGQQRGRKLGFPTANQNLAKKVSEGIYVSTAKVDNKIFQSVTFIGSAKTFNETKYQAETYILSFNKNIYYQWITVTLLKKLRDNKKFGSTEDLIKQMNQDKKETLKYFKHHE